MRRRSFLQCVACSLLLPALDWTWDRRARLHINQRTETPMRLTLSVWTNAAGNNRWDDTNNWDGPVPTDQHSKILVAADANWEGASIPSTLGEIEIPQGVKVTGTLRQVEYLRLGGRLVPWPRGLPVSFTARG